MDWTPLLQTLVWPVFIGLLILYARQNLAKLLSAFTQRIVDGASFEAGVSGVKLGAIEKGLQDVKQRIDTVEKREESLWKCARADSLREHGRLSEAERGFLDAQRLDPDNDLAVIGLAKVLRRKGELQRAIEILTNLISKNPDASRAIYNRACYKALLGLPREALTDLKAAIHIEPFYAEYARDDSDLDSLRSDAQFAALVGLAVDTSLPEKSPSGICGDGNVNEQSKSEFVPGSAAALSSRPAELPCDQSADREDKKVAQSGALTSLAPTTSPSVNDSPGNGCANGDHQGDDLKKI